MQAVTGALHKYMQPDKTFYRYRVSPSSGTVFLDEVHRAGKAFYMNVLLFFDSRERLFFIPSERKSPQEPILVFSSLAETGPSAPPPPPTLACMRAPSASRALYKFVCVRSCHPVVRGSTDGPCAMELTVGCHYRSKAAAFN